MHLISADFILYGGNNSELSHQESDSRSISTHDSHPDRSCTGVALLQVRRMNNSCIMATTTYPEYTRMKHT